MKKAKELEAKRLKELKEAREATISQIADVLVLTNYRQRGVNFDASVSAGVGALADAMNALMTDGDALKTAERKNFVKVWSSYVNTSGAKVPGLETTYQALNEGVANLYASGTLPAQFATQAPAAEEPPKKKKEPKPLPAAYIMKATDDKVVAEEDKQEEQVTAAIDDDFLGGFDAFDSDNEGGAQPAAKEESKTEAPAETQGDAPAQDGDGDAKKKRWEDSGDNKRGDNRGRGRGGRGNRGRGGRGRGGNPNVDDEGFEKVTD